MTARPLAVYIARELEEAGCAEEWASACLNESLAARGLCGTAREARRRRAG